MNAIHVAIKSIILFSLLSFNVVQAQDKIYTSFFSSKAVAGYDVVAYFTEQAPREGSSKFTVKYQGATWYFSSQENRDKFAASPADFVPQYGGYCAWAMSSNQAAPGNPPFWTVYNNKLYLNYDQEVLDTWRADKDAFIEKANANWAMMDKD